MYKLQGQSLIHVASDQVAGPLVEPRHEDAEVVLNVQCAPYAWSQIILF